MAWVKSVSVVSEDIFDEDGNDIILQHKEWNNNMSKRVKDGYRDGVDAGKEASLQRGFNIGYREGAEQMSVVGQLKGILSALQCWCQLQHPGSPAFFSVSHLLQDVSRHEEGLIERMKMSMGQQRPPPSVGEITEGVEDLGMEHSSTGCGGGGCSKEDCCREEQSPDGGPAALQAPCQGNTHPALSAGESMEQLLKSCMDLVVELGLPEELFGHLQQLSNL
ncbi:OTU deubiquitinase with linear linkage specificity a [Anguilla rostrata]|uniref:OTU deubiquitinase with linear linkage specificity a n=1 Tax=Anguilla anguilla TaxID=7936 RepID=UPI0015A7797B|nr:OTU deubiquitinase with linear linkage specificity a [Anguilla anguilla]